MRRELKNKIRRLRNKLPDSEIRRVLSGRRIRTDGDCLRAIRELEELESPDVGVIHEIHNLCHKFEITPPSPFAYNTKEKARKVLSGIASKKGTLV